MRVHWTGKGIVSNCGLAVGGADASSSSVEFKVKLSVWLN